MEIIAHRGFCSGPTKMPDARLIDALSLGFGIEFDVRDSADDIVIAHDPWERYAESFSSLLKALPPEGTLAVNIKSSGLAARIRGELEAHGVSPSRCFFFDMAVPDHLDYPKKGLRAYARISEIEPLGAFALQADGIWLDAFFSTWWDEALVVRLLEHGLKVCVVSPELHRRDRRPAWDTLRKAGLGGHAGLSLCTDYPLEARNFFAT